MVLLDSTIAANEQFVAKILKNVKETALKYSQIGEADTLLCHNSEYILKRKLAMLSRNGDKGKLVFLHGFDARTLFRSVLKDVVLDHYTSDDASVDAYIVTEILPERMESYIDILSGEQLRVYVVNGFASLQSKIHTGRSDKTVVFNFDRHVKYIACDLFMYLGVNLSPPEIRNMFNISALENLGHYIIIDTVTQSVAKNTRFIGQNKFGVLAQHEMTHFPLKNCPFAGKRFFDMLNKVISNVINVTSSADSADEDEDDEDSEDVDPVILNAISDTVAVFVDRDTDNYLLNFIYQYIGRIKHVDVVQRAWFNLTSCLSAVKIVCFAYIRSVPDFREIAAFCNGWKAMNPEPAELIVIVLTSPVLDPATNDSLTQYKTDFKALIQLANSANCCSGVHCEETLFRQFILTDQECDSSTGIETNEDVTQAIMRIFAAIEQFARNRANSFKPVFHEKELLDALPPHELNEDLVASFLYRGIPLVGKDGLLKVVSNLPGRTDLFVVKPDTQKYVTLYTLTGIQVSTPVNDILMNLSEEY